MLRGAKAFQTLTPGHPNKFETGTMRLQENDVVVGSEISANPPLFIVKASTGKESAVGPLRVENSSTPLQIQGRQLTHPRGRAQS